MDESKFGKGAIPDSYDIRDYKFVGRGTFDWDTGFDIEEHIGTKLVTKNQNGSGSCGGQAWAYYGEVLEKIATNNYEPRSARWIYSHTAAPGGGSAGRDNCDHVIKKGWVREELVPSYDHGEPPEEAFMLQKPELTPAIEEDAEVSRGLSYLSLSNVTMDEVAHAIKNNYGCILGVVGQNNGTWKSKFPKPPLYQGWAHWIYAGKAKKIDGKQYIGVKNSWGNIGDKGWQWLGEDYFARGPLGDRWVFSGWTLAWDYKPAKTKAILIQVIKVLQELIAKI